MNLVKIGRYIAEKRKSLANLYFNKIEGIIFNRK